MEFYLESFNKIKEFKPKIKEESIHSYIRNIRKINQELFKSDKPVIKYFQVGFETVKKYILSLPSLASQKTLTTALLVLLQAYKDSPENTKLYAELHKELSKKQEEAYLDNAKTPREEANWVSGEDIIDKIKYFNFLITSDKYKNTRQFIDLYQKYLILNLYTLLPPLRNDYVLVKVLDVDSLPEDIDSNFNYINLRDNTLYLYKYKTDKHYGVKKIEVPNDLMNMIKEYQAYKKAFYKSKLTHDFLLLNPTKRSEMPRNTLTKYLNKIFFPNKVSTTLLRKIYLSEKYPVVNTYRDQAHDAMVMGHSLATQKMIYSKKLD